MANKPYYPPVLPGERMERYWRALVVATAILMFLSVLILFIWLVFSAVKSGVALVSSFVSDSRNSPGWTFHCPQRVCSVPLHLQSLPIKGRTYMTYPILCDMFEGHLTCYMDQTN